MAKKLKLKNAILCEYVAMGSNNKHILLNVFSGDIIVGKFPTDIPVGLYIEVERESKEESTLNLEVNLGGDKLLHGEIRMDGEHLTGVVSVPQVRLQLENETNIEVVLTSKGYAKTVAISKRIYQGNLPSGQLTKA